MDILKTVITIIFVIDCIALAAIILLQEESQQDWVRSAEQQTHIGDIIKDVPWKELL